MSCLAICRNKGRHRRFLLVRIRSMNDRIHRGACSFAMELFDPTTAEVARARVVSFFSHMLNVVVKAGVFPVVVLDGRNVPAKLCERKRRSRYFPTSANSVHLDLNFSIWNCSDIFAENAEKPFNQLVK